MNLKALTVALLISCGPARPPLPTESSPGIVFPHHIAEGRGGGGPPVDVSKAAPPPSSGATPSSSAPAPATAPSAKSAARLSPPDPEPLRTPKQYELRLAYEGGRLSVAAVRALTFRQPVVTARNMGRFAVELWIGQELIDRVRFDFPLLDVKEPNATKRKALHEPPAFGGKLVATVLVPASARVRRAVVFDRATGEETELTWPPTATPSSAAPTPSSAAPTPSSVAPTPSSVAPTPSSVAPSAAPSAPARPR
jgi:hypothetical protein